MEKIKSILGYSWAIMTVPFAFAIMFSAPIIYQTLFEARGLKVTDRISGAEVVQVIERNEYSIYLHKPVFDGFFHERNSGFVQVDFIAETVLPLQIEEAIDYDLDNAPDFHISINTQSNEYSLKAATENVKQLGAEEVYVLENRRTIRVEIER
ncbi:hypothetical protein U27_04532 [Candidatus Vecturithrix granuli]|uniref:Uncharacterized protein n=1 Tax=Vecturithrix granuli TaxID=1499967 RepID=A0A081BZ10_VECG1|nr:hypothetical protein U27_04532 [Candidatus Vecturithrix granuli]